MFSINNIEWFFKFVEPDDLMLLKSDGSYTVGVCDNVTKTIYINTTLRGKFLKGLNGLFAKFLPLCNLIA